MGFYGAWALVCCDYSFGDPGGSIPGTLIGSCYGGSYRGAWRKSLGGGTNVGPFGDGILAGNWWGENSMGYTDVWSPVGSR